VWLNTECLVFSLLKMKKKCCISSSTFLRARLFPLVIVPLDVFIPPYMVTPDFLHAAMRPDMISATEVEISTEECCEEEEDEEEEEEEEEDDDEEMVTLHEEPEPGHQPVRKRRGRREGLMFNNRM